MILKICTSQMKYHFCAFYATRTDHPTPSLALLSLSLICARGISIHCVIGMCTSIDSMNSIRRSTLFNFVLIIACIVCTLYTKLQMLSNPFVGTYDNHRNRIIPVYKYLGVMRVNNDCVPIVDWCRRVLIKTNLINVSHVEIVTRILNSEIKFQLTGVELGSKCVSVFVCEKSVNSRLFMRLYEGLLISSHIKTIV